MNRQCATSARKHFSRLPSKTSGAAFATLTPAEQSEALQCVLKGVTVHPGKLSLEIFELDEFCPSSQNRKEWLPGLDSSLSRCARVSESGSPQAKSRAEPRDLSGKLAPRARFELATFRLTAERSTVELPGSSLRSRGKREIQTRKSVKVERHSGVNALQEITTRESSRPG